MPFYFRSRWNRFRNLYRGWIIVLKISPMILGLEVF
jgi:hypothetical protein